MEYEQLLQQLLSVNLHGGIKLGLNNCIKLNEALGSPVNKFSTIHVAGTNGKGSVVTKIAAAYQALGLRVGLYTSPHISCFRERIRINGLMISEQAVKRHLECIFSIISQKNIPATFFEITTLMAFAYFAEEKVDIAVIETGLGGRLDATNIVQPILSIITSISLDHTEILGKTIEQIAMEKAGIIKPNTPIIIGPRVPFELIQNVARTHSCPCIRVEGSFNHFQDENNAIAKAALKYLKIPEYAIEQGLSATPPCRVETWLPDQLRAIFPNPLLPKAVILDVAHNPDGITQLIASVKQRFPGCSMRFVVGLSKSKDISSCLQLIRKAASHIYIIEAEGYRAASKQDLYNELNSQGIDKELMTKGFSIHQTVHEAIIAGGKSVNEIVIICGTFFIMSEARSSLGIIEEQDPCLLL